MAVFDLESVPNNDLDETADGLVGELPEPQQHAIDQATADQAADPATAPDPAVELDALGVPWNPEIHATSATTGKGVRTAKGAWRKRKGLKGSSPYLNTGAAAAPKEDPEVTARKTQEHQNRMAGAMAGTMVVRLSAAVGGPEFLPRTITVPGGLTYNEEEFLQTAFGDYFVAKGISDIPPGMVLTSALAMYYLPRFQQPAVRERSGRVVSWFKEKVSFLWLRWKYRKSGGKPPGESKSGAEKGPRASDNVATAQRAA